MQIAPVAQLPHVPPQPSLPQVYGFNAVAAVQSLTHEGAHALVHLHLPDASKDALPAHVKQS